eukprot:CAMPEP_0195008766 /NCGR_PEP_ID=MMETSP0326_2-20130528/8716_1 /TAXON_ID=2866 ORGANISM="Crypthecodinium cohnii, Strain Seligo" /NCGR_SAMPLE_ID=MMETSP0326_2 /ASSEMBLY_ACC=CAM_ASM_000348 /LENGTH=50 /DNA_ID=CAMNT_0040016683 /DNA_START=811 /DNA_END=963 /DNA_ORIENTATION=-
MGATSKKLASEKHSTTGTKTPHRLRGIEMIMPVKFPAANATPSVMSNAVN